MVWEIVFLLIVLKIPIVYLGLVVWWAVRAEPRPADPLQPVAVTDTPSGPRGGRTRRPLQPVGRGPVRRTPSLGRPSGVSRRRTVVGRVRATGRQRRAWTP